MYSVFIDQTLKRMKGKKNIHVHHLINLSSQSFLLNRFVLEIAQDTK